MKSFNNSLGHDTCECLCIKVAIMYLESRIIILIHQSLAGTHILLLEKVEDILGHFVFLIISPGSF